MGTPTTLSPDARSLESRYSSVRGFTEQLTSPLSPEDCAIQTMPDVSPTRWHLAHTTWFFETFVLAEIRGHRPFDPDFAYLFNSYYNGIGEQFPRAKRGLLSRPGLARVMAYRHHVDREMRAILARGVSPELERRTILGLHHEQQHQELILTDIKHVLSQSPLRPALWLGKPSGAAASTEARFVPFEGGIYEIGHAGDGFHFDNEGPRHRALLEAFEIASRPVSCGEYLDFMDDGGYRRPELWLSLGWEAVRTEGWRAPLYWLAEKGGYRQFTLEGPRPVELAAPVCHVSYFEADAYARWARSRLPSEAEWEVASRTVPRTGHFVDTLRAEGRAIGPCAAPQGDQPLQQMFGDVWEWTASPYVPYPRFQPAPGAIGEYNGKFMCNQYVLRGGSCATSSDHVRPTYRNFFPPDARWQFSGFRLARDSGLAG